MNAELTTMAGSGAPQRAVLEDEIEEVLATISLVADAPELQPRLFTQLVDVLVRAAFADLRDRFSEGELTRRAYVIELSELARQCRRAGLLQLPLADG